MPHHLEEENEVEYGEDQAEIAIEQSRQVVDDQLDDYLDEVEVANDLHASCDWTPAAEPLDKPHITMFY